MSLITSDSVGDGIFYQWPIDRGQVAGVALAATFVFVPVFAELLDHSTPTPAGWVAAGLAAIAILVADAAYKRLQRIRKGAGRTVAWFYS